MMLRIGVFSMVRNAKLDLLGLSLYHSVRVTLI